MPLFIAWVHETRPTEGFVAYGIEAADYDDAVVKARLALGPFAHVDKDPQPQKTQRRAA